jgi:MscS family membrane protein
VKPTPQQNLFTRRGAILAAILFGALPVLELAACAQAVSGPPPGSAAKTSPKPEDPLHRDSPQGAVLSFLQSCRAGNFAQAAKYLNFRGIPHDQRVKEGPRAAQQLDQLLDRDPAFDVAALSRNSEGGHEDGLPPDRERVASFKVGNQTFELQMERVTLRSGLAVWLFSEDSVKLIPKLALATSDHPVEKYLPEPLVNSILLDTPLWRWIALALLALAVAAIARIFSRIGLALAERAAKRFGPKAAHGVMDFLWPPLLGLICLALFRAGMEWVGPQGRFRLYMERGLTLAFFLGLAWLAARLIDLGLEHLRSTMLARHGKFSSSVVPLVSRLIKLSVLLLAIAAVLSEWGYNATAILAGLGVGSIAIALAAQKTIENFFGGVSVISDRPVSVGDLCKVGDLMGTVEDIGLRSTRIRTLNRTMVSVPNGQFSSMTLENFEKRDKMLFHVTLNLRRDSTPDQVRMVLNSIARILAENSKVEAGAFPVRFVGVGTYSLDIEIFVYVLTRDGDDFLRTQQDLLLKILDAVKDAGTALALPTQASVDYSTNPGRSAVPQELLPAGRN